MKEYLMDVSLLCDRERRNDGREMGDSVHRETLRNLLGGADSDVPLPPAASRGPTFSATPPTLSSNPSKRRAKNRVRHLPTVCFISRNSCATRVFVVPPGLTSDAGRFVLASLLQLCLLPLAR